MKIVKFEDNEAWLEARRGRITGSRLKDIIIKRSGSGDKMGYYELIAERLALPADGENVMDRGHRLEVEAIRMFEFETGKTVNTDLVIWERDDNARIAISPDGVVEESHGVALEIVVVGTIGTREAIGEAVEAKCLSSAKHIKAFLLQEIPDEYDEQSVQYFICNDQLETLYFAFFDPRLMVEQFFYLTITRAQVIDRIEKYHIDQINVLDRVDAVVAKLMPF